MYPELREGGHSGSFSSREEVPPEGERPACPRESPTTHSESATSPAAGVMRQPRRSPRPEGARPYAPRRGSHPAGPNTRTSLDEHRSFRHVVPDPPTRSTSASPPGRPASPSPAGGPSRLRACRPSGKGLEARVHHRFHAACSHQSNRPLARHLSSTARRPNESRAGLYGLRRGESSSRRSRSNLDRILGREGRPVPGSACLARRGKRTSRIGPPGEHRSVVDDRMARTTLGRGNGKGGPRRQRPPPTPEGKTGRSRAAGHQETAPRPSIPARRPARRRAIVTGGTQEGAGKHAAKVHREEGPTRLPITGGVSTGPGAVTREPSGYR